MNEVKNVFVQVAAPVGGNPGAVEVGHYVVEDDTVVLTDEAGVPLRYDVSGECFSERLGSDQDEQVLARALLHRWRRHRMGDDKNGFNRPLNYPRLGWL